MLTDGSVTWPYMLRCWFLFPGLSNSPQKVICCHPSCPSASATASTNMRPRAWASCCRRPIFGCACAGGTWGTRNKKRAMARKLSRIEVLHGIYKTQLAPPRERALQLLPTFRGSPSLSSEHVMHAALGRIDREGRMDSFAVKSVVFDEWLRQKVRTYRAQTDTNSFQSWHSHRLPPWRVHRCGRSLLSGKFEYALCNIDVSGRF